MFNKYFFIAAFLFLGGCSSIPEVSVTNLLKGLDEAEVEAEVEDPVAELKSRGDGYLSFNYNSGHLDRITIELKEEKIVLLKGQTVIKKVPVGRYSFDVSSRQTDTRSYSAELSYDGDTHESIINIPSRYSNIGFRDISERNLNHSLGQLVVGSRLVNPLIELTKLDQPPHTLEIACSVERDLEVGDIFTSGRARGEIAKVTDVVVVTGRSDNGQPLYGTKTCGYSDNVTYTSPLRMSLPEGSYLLNASGKSRKLYVKGESINTIEISSKGFEVSTESR
jgi:hypothetical protein